MRHLIYFLLVVLSLALLPGCGKKEDAPVPTPPAVVGEIERQRERAEQQRERADREQKAKEEVQQKREAADQRADFWKTMVWVVLITGVLFTLVGVSLGSSAKKKADRARTHE